MLGPIYPREKSTLVSLKQVPLTSVHAWAVNNIHSTYLYNREQRADDRSRRDLAHEIETLFASKNHASDQR